MTMKDLARLANVSVSTVSKAFCDADDVSRETKDRIFAIAKKNGCYGKFYKGKYHKKIIAIIVPEVKSNYYTAFVEEFQRLIEEAGGICAISSDNFSAARQAELIEYYASYMKVDGIIVFGLRKELKRGYETPIVSLFSSVDEKVDNVDIDLESAMTEAIKALQEHGHEKIAFISERLTFARARYYENVMKKLGNMNIIKVESNERFEKAGVDGVKRLFELGKEFTAIICAYDYIAFGAMKQLKKSGFSVPDDISVVGIDNVSQSEYADTSLSSMDSRPSEVCQIVYDLLEKKMKNPYFKSRQNIKISTQFIIRESVARKK